MNVLHASLPNRFHGAIQMCLDSMGDIMKLPTVLTHKDFGACNLLVDKNTCHLQGVVDWAEAEICPFGLNLHSVLAFVGSIHLKNGWTAFPDFKDLQKLFWDVLKKSAGLSDDTVIVVQRAQVLGKLRSHGFTSRLANQEKPVPIKDDEYGRYQLMYLDAFLISQWTKVDGIDT